MLWRVRASLPDRPGSLAVLARHCGEAGVNIMGLQVFPGLGSVTDELVLSTPLGWGPGEVGALVEGAGGRTVSAAPCTEQALADQPTRHVQAARAVLASPASFPEVVARLLDADATGKAEAAAGLDVMDLVVDEVSVQLRRSTPFTATEHARGAALAGLVSDVWHRARHEAPPSEAAPAGRSPAAGQDPALVTSADAVAYVVAGATVARAVLGPGTEPGVRPLTLGVDAAWRRRGLGSRLLVEAARLAASQGAREVLLTAEAGNRAVMPMVLASGLRGRIRMAGDELTVRLPVHELGQVPQ